MQPAYDSNKRMQSSNRSQTPNKSLLEGKDLVIRMLAEVFQVVRTESTGQLRWHQLSSSLVPVSLYSRTTSNWLDYLAVASALTSDQEQNAMSPDSRQLLLSLQQFHHNQKQRNLLRQQQQQQQQQSQTTTTSNAPTHEWHHEARDGSNTMMMNTNNAIVFQVAAHDFIEGRCKIILNSKLSQPGTRIGQASDYFVYWRDSSNSSSSAINNANNNNNNNLDKNQCSLMNSAYGELVCSCKSGLDHPHLRQQNEALNNSQSVSSFNSNPIWGLNFASVNDANLFYDICSLNLTDLDFNHEYLKQLSSQSLGKRSNSTTRKHQATTRPTTSMTNNLLLQYQAPWLQQNQDRSHLSSMGPGGGHQMQRERFFTMRPHPRGGNLGDLGQETPLCIACKDSIEVASNRKNRTSRLVNRQPRPHEHGSVFDPCPVHKQQKQQTPMGAVKRQARSKSSGNRTTELIDGRHRAAGDSWWSRNESSSSFNMARSQSFSTPTSAERAAYGLARTGPRTEQELGAVITDQLAMTNGLQQPKKPARGVPRLEPSHGSSGNLQLDSNLATAAQQLDAGSRLLGTNEYGLFRGQPLEAHFPANRLAVRRSTGIDSRNIRDLNQHLNNHARPARLARAQYANSRNMNDFLSLDVGNNKKANDNQDTSSNKNNNQTGTLKDLINGMKHPEAAGPATSKIATTESELTGHHDQNKQQLREVATTTDDLPLDSDIRKRLFELNKQSDTSTSKSDPALRRRSLERSTCIDLDQASVFSAPANRAAAERLSPLAQSCTSLASTINNNNQPEVPSDITNPVQPINKSNLNQSQPASLKIRARQQEKRLNDLCSADTRPTPRGGSGRSRTKSSGEATMRRLRVSTRELAAASNDTPATRHWYQQHGCHLNHATSAPDVRSAFDLGLVWPSHSGHTHNHHNNQHYLLQAPNEAFANQDQPRHLDPLSSNGHDGARISSALPGYQANDSLWAGWRYRRQFCGACMSSSQTDHKLYYQAPQTHRFAHHQHPQYQQEFQSSPELERHFSSMGQYSSPEFCPSLIPHHHHQYQQHQQQTNPIPASYCSCYRHPLANRSQFLSNCHHTINDHVNAAHTNRPHYHIQQQQLKNHSKSGPEFSANPASDPWSSHGNHITDKPTWSPCMKTTTNAHLTKNEPIKRACYLQYKQLASDPTQAVPCFTPQSLRQDPEHNRCFQNMNNTASSSFDRSPVHLSLWCDSIGDGVAGPGEVPISREKTIQNHLNYDKERRRNKRHTNQLRSETNNNNEKLRSGDEYKENSAEDDGEISLSDAHPNHHQYHESECEDSQVSDGFNGSNDYNSKNSFSKTTKFYSMKEARRNVNRYHGAGQYEQQSATRALSSCGQMSSSNEHPPGNGTTSPYSSYRRPVENYDRCLNRQALKSRPRPRAKSQPPSINTSQRSPRDPNQLAKSIENVQKLIREVQLELDSFSLFDSHDYKQRTTPNKTTTRLITDEDYESKTISKKRNRMSVYETNQLDDSNDKQVDRNSEMDNSKKLARQQPEPSGPSSRSRSPRIPPDQYVRDRSELLGPMRKAGFLMAKKWINNTGDSIGLAKGKVWRRAWVCLRGSTIVVHNCAQPPKGTNNCSQPASRSQANNKNKDDELDHQEPVVVNLGSWIEENDCFENKQLLLDSLYQESIMETLNTKNHQEIQSTSGKQQFRKYLRETFIEHEPKFWSSIEGAIAQHIPEHPRLENVFCLSNKFGEAFLFQASSLSETQNWILAIHNACAAFLGRNLTRSENVKLLETRIRDLELDAEKKLFHKIRVESRLDSMCPLGYTLGSSQDHRRKSNINEDEKTLENQSQSSDDMRSLLTKLKEQLVELSRYLEQIHCEIYKLRCYLLACLKTYDFYQIHNEENFDGQSPGSTTLFNNLSEPTRAFLSEFLDGNYIVSIIHSYIHAREARGSGDNVKSREVDSMIPSIEPNHFSESLVARDQLERLDVATEQLLEDTKLVIVSVRLKPDLYTKIARNIDNVDQYKHPWKTEYSMSADLEWVRIDCKFHETANSLTILKRLMGIISHWEAKEMDFLSYYLVIHTRQQQHSKSKDGNHLGELLKQQPSLVVCKRFDKLKDLVSKGDFDFLELRERILFQVKLSRHALDRQMSEDTLPFGLSLEGQLFAASGPQRKKQLLSVYCSFIEWRSEAECKGLSEEDEILSFNGIKTIHLDMMFIEWLMSQERSHVTLEVASSGCRESESAEPRLVPSNDSPGDRDDDSHHKDSSESSSSNNNKKKLESGDNGELRKGSHPMNQVMDDAYLSALICPPPPSSSNKRQQQHNKETHLELDPSEILLKSHRSHSSETISRPDSDFNSENGEVLPPDQQHQQHQHHINNHHSSVVIEKDANAKEEDELEVNENLSQLCILKLPEQNNLERSKRSLIELLVTESTYIQHLEEMLAHFIRPLAEVNYLEIKSLRMMGEFLLPLAGKHRKFLAKLLYQLLPMMNRTTTIDTNSELEAFKQLAKEENPENCDSDQLENLLDQLRDQINEESHLNSQSQWDLLMQTLGHAFHQLADELKSYSGYCVAYTRFQRFFHPKLASHASIGSFSNPFNPTHHSTMIPHHHHHPKPLESLIKPGRTRDLYLHSEVPEEGASKLKQLNKFLHNLDNRNQQQTSSNSLSLSTGSFKSSLSKSTSKHSLNNSNNKDQQASEGNNSFKQTLRASARDLLSISSTSTTSNHTNTSNQQQQQDTSNCLCFKPNKSKLNFTSYLIRPVQCITRYPLLLNSLMANVSRCWSSNEVAASTEGELALRTAIKTMEGVAGHMNEMQTIYDLFGATFELLKEEHLEQTRRSKSTSSTTTSSSVPLQRSSHQPALELTVEHLLYSGPVHWLNQGQFVSAKEEAQQAKAAYQTQQMVFVFDSCVLLISYELVNGSSGSSNQQTTITTTDNKDNPSCFQSASHSPKSPIGDSLVQASALQHAPGGHCSSKAARAHGRVAYHALIPVSQVTVRAVAEAREPSHRPVGQSTSCCSHSLFEWELIWCEPTKNTSNLFRKNSKLHSAAANGANTTSQHRRGKGVYLFANETNETRNLFLRKIRQTIRQSVSKMSLPSKLHSQVAQQQEHQIKNNNNNNMHDSQSNTKTITTNIKQQQEISIKKDNSENISSGPASASSPSGSSEENLDDSAGGSSQRHVAAVGRNLGTNRNPTTRTSDSQTRNGDTGKFALVLQ